MKDIRCEFTGRFYISVPNNATPDDIEDALIKYMNAIEDLDIIAIEEFNWEECV